VKGGVGTIGQNHIRPDIVQQMADEMLCCTFDEFLCHYAPFHPNEKSVDDALTYLNDQQLLQDGEWQDPHGQNTPSKTQEIETAVFKKLEPIVHALRDEKKVRADSDPSDKHRKCIFDYRDCGNTPIYEEIAGCTFQVNACFLPGLPGSPCPSSGITASQVAVAAEFKKSRNDFYDVSTRILEC